MTVANQDFRVYRGDSCQIDVALTAADGTTFRIDAGTQLRWVMTRFPSDESKAAVVKTLNDGIGPIDGGVLISLSATDTDLPPGQYYHELKIFDVADVATAMTGTVVIQRSAKMSAPMSVEAGGQPRTSIHLTASAA
jgi:hypothetical protein